MTSNYLAYVAAFLFSSFAVAEFDIPITGKIIYPNKTEQPVHSRISFLKNENGYVFTIGKQSLNVASVPKKYSHVISLQEHILWAPELSKKALAGFEFTILDNKISMIKEPSAIKAPGLYVLRINDDVYHFYRGPGQIHFHLNENGLTEISVENMLKLPKTTQKEPN